MIDRSFLDVLIDTLRHNTVVSATNDIRTWYVHEKKYNKLRWYAHCAKVYREPPRKLRKCEMRAIAKRQASERKRYE